VPKILNKLAKKKKARKEVRRVRVNKVESQVVVLAEVKQVAAREELWKALLVLYPKSQKH